MCNLKFAKIRIKIFLMNLFNYFLNIFKRPSQTVCSIQSFPNDNNEKSSDQNNNSIKNQQSILLPNKIWSDERILTNRMLSDNEIFASIEILKRQFKHKNLKGLYDPIVMSQRKTKKFQFQIEYPDRFIQILHDGKLHWFTITNLKSNNSNQIQVYDSLYSDQTYLNNEILQNNLRKLILAKWSTNESSLCVELCIKPVQKQSDHLMCGVFSIAFAFDLCQDIDPFSRVYDESKMREHLFKCLNQNYFEQFPLLDVKYHKFQRIQEQIIFIEL